MISLYQEDLAYIHATAYGGLALGASPEIVRVLKSATVPIRRVVDVGCGAGPLTAALVEAGFEAVGMDASAELLAIARTTVPSAQFIHGSAYSVEFPKCDAVVAIGEVLSYHSQDADADRLVGDFLHRVAAALPLGGKFIFDVIELGEPSLTGRVWNSGEDWAVLVQTEENQIAQTVTRNIEIFRSIGDCYRRSREVHRLRCFDSEILFAQLSACGFETTTQRAYGAQPLSPRRRAFIATRIR
jgi:SAM-dependent methyltransferase